MDVQILRSADFDGVSFGAIKVLEERTSQLQQENNEFKNKMNIVLARLDELEINNMENINNKNKTTSTK